MTRYSALIRKLIQASHEALLQKTDIAECLKARCVGEADIIRQTLMNAVCDPRFRMYIDAAPSWRENARQQLERLATRLASIENLCAEVAVDEMDDMLAQWCETMLHQFEIRAGKPHFVQCDNSYKGQAIKKALDEYIYGAGMQVEDDEADDEQPHWTGEMTEDAMDYSPQTDQNLDTHNNDNNNDNDDDGYDEDESDEQDEQEQPFHPVTQPGSGMVGKASEQRFLSHVPPSLIKLARLIGRSTDQAEHPSGTFMSASKSDISGITTGNDLGCLLPSELAMMAGKETENIFFKDYVTRSLQVFASISHSSNDNKNHRDGPIIMCLDSSSSMNGEPFIVAMALTFAVCIIAQRLKRRVIVINYSDYHDAFFVTNLEQQRQELADFIARRMGNGNNENELFRWLFGELLPAQREYQNGDILCISDFGWTPISPQVMEIIKAEKEKNMKFYGLNIGNGDTAHLHSFSARYGAGFGFSDEGDWGSPADVCDSLWEYSGGLCREVREVQ